jgi:hypothetical protein
MKRFYRIKERTAHAVDKAHLWLYELDSSLPQEEYVESAKKLTQVFANRGVDLIVIPSGRGRLVDLGPKLVEEDKVALLRKM